MSLELVTNAIKLGQMKREKVHLESVQALVADMIEGRDTAILAGGVPCSVYLRAAEEPVVRTGRLLDVKRYSPEEAKARALRATELGIEGLTVATINEAIAGEILRMQVSVDKVNYAIATGVKS